MAVRLSKPVVGGAHGRFPDLAFLDFAVTHEDVNPAVAAVQAGRQGQAVGDGQALAQGAGGDLHARRAGGVGMALQDAAELAQGGELLPGEITQAGEHGIEGRGAVALGEDEAVPVGPAGIAGPDAHLGEEQGHQDVGGRQRPAQVPGAGAMKHLNDVQAHLPGDFLEPGGVWGGGLWGSSYLIFHYFSVFMFFMIFRKG